MRFITIIIINQQKRQYIQIHVSLTCQSIPRIENIRQYYRSELSRGLDFTINPHSGR